MLVQIEMYATNEHYIEHEDGGDNNTLTSMLKESELIYLADHFDFFTGR